MKALNACRFALVAVLSAPWLATPSMAQAITEEDIEALVVALETGEYSDEMAAQAETIKALQESTGMTIDEVIVLLQRLSPADLDGFAAVYAQIAADEGLLGRGQLEKLAIDSLTEMPVPSLVQSGLAGSGTGSELEP
ncbi:hypothetical protein [Pelagibacterium xiamenense]|uniref:hypothetical protein n=1 Tax=Pelagibacterium xiamenense TaxID=2901140 RepID=UPI001E2A9435|nr:hypothetical protein [Pelagibacterium xiamenense]MCD7059998.1 hypothetical protein [Pelagibacterium xiamenense]